jgi:hypothetical protein
MDLATEIAQHLQSRDPEDIDFVAHWLVHGGDAGEPTTDFVLKFESEQELPSRHRVHSPSQAPH